MPCCADLWPLTCVHTVRSWTGTGWRSCCLWMFSADCCSCLLRKIENLGRLQVCSHGSWKAIPAHWQRELCPLLPLAPAHPKNSSCYSGTALNLQEKGHLSAKPLAKPPGCHWFPGFIFLGRSISDYISVCSSFLGFLEVTGKRRFNWYLVKGSRRHLNEIYDF